MEALGNLGNFYIILMFLILIGGTAVIAGQLSKKIWDNSEKLLDKKGGKTMNKWIKLAVISFAGIIIATFALGLVSSASGQDAHSAHSGGGGAQAVSTQGGLPGGQSSYGTPAAYGGQVNTGGSMEAQMYQLRMNMIMLQQQMNQLMQMNNQQMNNSGSGGGMGMM